MLALKRRGSDVRGRYGILECIQATMEVSAMIDLANLLQQVVLFVPKVIAAVIIFGLSLIGARLAANWSRRTLTKHLHQPEMVQLLIRLVRWGIMIAGTLAALEQVDFNVSTFLAGLGVAGLTVGFALQDIARNFIAGIILLVRRPFEIGQAVSVAGYSGTVMDVRTRDTTIKTWDGIHIILPNLKVIEGPVTNYSAASRRRRTIRVGIGAEQDVKQAQQVFRQALLNVEGVLAAPAPMVHAEEFGDFAITLALRFWLDPQSASLLDVHSDAVAAIQKAAAEHNIELPYPIQVVRLAKHVQEPACCR